METGRFKSELNHRQFPEDPFDKALSLGSLNRSPRPMDSMQ
jgi:hypothetical protein